MSRFWYVYDALAFVWAVTIATLLVVNGDLWRGVFFYGVAGVVMLLFLKSRATAKYIAEIQKKIDESEERVLAWQEQLDKIQGRRL